MTNYDDWKTGGPSPGIDPAAQRAQDRADDATCDAHNRLAGLCRDVEITAEDEGDEARYDVSLSLRFSCQPDGGVVMAELRDQLLMLAEALR